MGEGRSGGKLVVALKGKTPVIVHVALVMAHEIAGRHGLISAMIHGHKGFTESEHQALHADWDVAFSVQADLSSGTEGLDDITSNNGDDTKPRNE